MGGLFTRGWGVFEWVGAGAMALISVLPMRASGVDHPPVNTAAPSVLGAAVPGDWIGAASGAWNDDLDGNPDPISFGWRWQRGASAEATSFVDIVGAGDAVYKVAAMDVGTYLRCVVTATDGGDSGMNVAEVASAALPVLASGPGEQVRSGVWGKFLPSATLFRQSDQSIEVAPDGSLYVFGDFGFDEGVVRRGLFRVGVDGKLDESFPPLTSFVGPWASKPQIRDLKVLPDGRIVIVGNFSRINGRDCKGIAVLFPDGTHDPGFACEGTIVGKINTVFVQPDGDFLVSGSFYEIDGVTRGGFARIGDDGVVDPSYAPILTNGSNPGPVFNVGFRSDGKSIVFGIFDEVNGVPRDRIALLNVDGSIDSSFDAGRIGGFPYRIAVLPDGSLYVFGNQLLYGGVGPTAAIRLAPDGTLDPSFALSDPAIQSAFFSGLLEDGDLVLTRENLQLVRVSPVGDLRFHYEGYEWDGAWDFAVGGNGDAFMFGVGGMVVGEFFYTDLIRFSGTDGLADRSYGAVPGTRGTVEAVSTAPDGRIYLGGSFAEEIGGPVGAAGRAVGGVVRLLPDFSPDVGFTPPVLERVETGGLKSAIVHAMALLPDGRILVGGDIALRDGLAASPLMRLHINGTYDSTFLPDSKVKRVVKSIAVQPDGMILVATVPRYPAQQPPKLHRLFPDGSLDASFEPEADPDFPSGAGIVKIAVRSNGKIVCLGGPNGLFQLNADGSFDDGFQVEAPTYLLVSGDMVLLPDERVLYTYGNGIHQVLPDGSPDPAFATALEAPESSVFYDWCNALLRQADGKVVVAHSRTNLLSGYNESLGFGLFRINPDGTIDPSFRLRGAKGIPDDHYEYSTVNTLVGFGVDVLVGGRFVELGGKSALGLAMVDGGNFATPSNTVAPMLAGNFLPGFVVDGSDGVWEGSGHAFDYYWEIADDALGSNRVVVEGADVDSMIAGEATAGKYVRLVVRAADGTAGPPDLVFGEVAADWVEIPEMTYARWRVVHFGGGSDAAGDASFDADGDGFTNMEEFCFGTNPFIPTGGLVAQSAIVMNGEHYLGVEFGSPVGAPGIDHVVERSFDFSSWASVDAVSGDGLSVLVSETLNGDGTKTSLWRYMEPCATNAAAYLRVCGEESY